MEFIVNISAKNWNTTSPDQISAIGSEPENSTNILLNYDMIIKS